MRRSARAGSPLEKLALGLPPWRLRIAQASLASPFGLSSVGLRVSCTGPIGCFPLLLRFIRPALRKAIAPTYKTLQYPKII